MAVRLGRDWPVMFFAIWDYHSKNWDWTKNYVLDKFQPNCRPFCRNMSQDFLELGRYTKQNKTDGSNTKQPSSSAFARCAWTRRFTSPSRGRAGSDWTRSMTGQTASGCTAAPGGPRSPRSSWVASTTASNMRSAATIFGILGWAVRNRMNRQPPSDQSGFHMISYDLQPAHTHTLDKNGSL